MIIIIDTGLGNIGAICNLIKKCGIKDAKPSSNFSDLKACTGIILPGVGSFDYGMKKLQQFGLPTAIQEAANRHIPILGICLGFQLMTNGSEEGELDGLGLISARTVKFRTEYPNAPSVKVPHMGWENVHITSPNTLMDETNGTQQRYYFTHSYHVCCDIPSDVIATAHYGITFTAAVAHRNIYGCQFHPEKSHMFGLKLMRNFCELTKRKRES